MTGSIITFYSYKGGVGRTFALSNIGVLLGRWGFRVLCIDWDLDAPGLSHFFASTVAETVSPDTKGQPGLVELLHDFRRTKQVPIQWRDYVVQLNSKRAPGVSLLTSGRVDSTYSKRLHRLSWAGLYRSGLGNALEAMFEELRTEYDYVLIDARTGITDFSGVVTAQLPDILAFLFTANEQSFMGATDVARRAAKARNELPIDRSRLLLLPIPARFETQLEHTISTEWKNRFSHDLRDFYEPWAVPEVSYSKLVQLTTIPYVPFWSFGERLSVLDDSSNDPLSINYSLETIAAILAHRLGQTRLLLESRDEYVAAARRVAQTSPNTQPSIFVSYSHEDAQIAHRLIESLARRGISATAPESSEKHGAHLDSVTNEIDRSAHMVVLLGKQWDGPAREHEIRTFLRQAASDAAMRLLLPVVLSKEQLPHMPSILRHYRAIVASGDYDGVAEQILRAVQPSSSTNVTERSQLRVRVTSDGDLPIEHVMVCALARNGTSIDSITDAMGIASLNLLPGRAYNLLIAHPSHPARILDDFHAGGTLEVRLSTRRDAGSIVVHSTGYVPGLEGRLNLILDTQNRTYLYADNIAVNGGQIQPVHFSINQPIELEDASGNRFQVTVRLIAGRTSLLDYRRLERAHLHTH